MKLVLPKRARRDQRRLVEYEYLPKQGTFLKNCREVNYSGYIGGFGSGKTHILCIEALILGSIPGSHGLLGAPTYRMLEDTTQDKFFALCPASWIRNFSKQRNMVELVNDATILFRSMENPGRLAGLDIDWFGIDEGGLVKEETFKMLQGRLKVSKIRRGIVVGNPAGPTHWTYKYFVQLAKKFPSVYRLVQSPSGENTFLPREFIRDMDISFGVGTAYHKQYVLGQFVAFEGAYWPNFNPQPYPDGHTMSTADAIKASKAGVQKWGRVIDFGFEHPFVCMWYFTDGKKIVFFDEYYQQHGLIKYHCLKMRQKEDAHQEIFGPHRVTSTWTDHEAVSRAEISAAKDDEGNRIGFDCVPVEKKVMESILLVQSLFGMRRLFITENCEVAQREIPSYHSKKEIVGEEPVREDDDTCCCVRYATWAELNHTIPYKRYKNLGYETSNIEDIFDAEVTWQK